MAEEEYLDDEFSPDTEEIVEDDALIPVVESHPIFSRKQWTLIALTTLLSFLVFLIVLFPYDLLIRYIIDSVSGRIRIEFLEMNPSLFGTTEIKDLRVVLSPKESVEAENVSIHLSPFQLFNRNAHGTVFGSRINVDLQELGIEVGALSGDLNLDGLDMPPASWNGDVLVNGSNIFFNDIPPIMKFVPLQPDEYRIKKIKVNSIFSGGRFDLKGSSAITELFTVKVENGGGRFDKRGNVILDGRICITPVKDLEKKNENIMQMIAILGIDPTRPFCYKVSGPMNHNPRFEKEPQVSDNVPKAE